MFIFADKMEARLNGVLYPVQKALLEPGHPSSSWWVVFRPWPKGAGLRIFKNLLKIVQGDFLVCGTSSSVYWGTIEWVEKKLGSINHSDEEMTGLTAYVTVSVNAVYPGNVPDWIHWAASMVPELQRLGGDILLPVNALYTSFKDCEWYAAEERYVLSHRPATSMSRLPLIGESSVQAYEDRYCSDVEVKPGVPIQDYMAFVGRAGYAYTFEAYKALRG